MKTSPLTSRRSQGGFSLIEVLAAFVVFALAYAAILQILAGSVRNAVRSAEYTQAALWAQSKMDTLGIEAPIEEGSDGGEFDANYRWQLDVRPYEIPDVDPSLTTLDGGEFVQLYLCELQVIWGPRGGERSARFVTLRAAVPEEIPR